MSKGNGRIDGRFRVVVGVPCQDMVAQGFAKDLANLVGFTGATAQDVVKQLRVHFQESSILVWQRRIIAKVALDNDMTHILWLDSDMRFPPDALLQLLAHNQPIVGANYVARRPPNIKPVALADFSEDGKIRECVYTHEHSTGLQQVRALGMGVMLTATEVFKRVPEPWFTMEWAGTGYEGEDIGFCRRAMDAGIPTFVDHALSQSVEHIGTMQYTHDHALAVREEVAT